MAVKELGAVPFLDSQILTYNDRRAVAYQPSTLEEEIMRKVILILLTVLLLAACSQPTAQLAEPTAITQPTKTPLPTETTEPSPTLEPEPEPVVYEGTGDALLTITKPIEGDMCFMFVQGNAAGAFFGIRSYDAEGNPLHLLVSTEIPYIGTRLLDGSPAEQTAVLEIKAEGPWQIQLLSFSSSYMVQFMIDVPGTLSGTSDRVVLTRGQSSTIAVNYSDNKHFAVFAHGTSTGNLVFNEQGAYAGEATLPEKTVMLEIIAEGNWQIEIK